MKIVKLIIFLYCITLSSQTKNQYKIHTIAFYNLENLFDTINNPNTRDDDRTPTGKDKYTSKIYRDKIKKLSEVIVQIGAKTSKKPPTILGVCEIENFEVLEDLVSSDILKQYGYKIIQYDSPDSRGIDTALLYREEFFALEDHKAFELKIWDEKGYRIYTRDQLMVSGYLEDDKVYFIVNHWPSRWGGEKRSRPKRVKAAILTKKIITEIKSYDIDAKIIVMGDFNDNPNDKSFSEILETDKYKEIGNGKELYSPFIRMFDNGLNTLVYNDYFHLFDQFFFTKNLISTPNKKGLIYYKSGIYNADFLKQKEGKYKGYPFRSYQSGQYTGGYSDHFPVYIYLVSKIKKAI